MVPILVIGSINMDLVARLSQPPVPGQTTLAEDFAMVPGGKGANQAVAASRLGGAVSLIGRVGADSFGQVLLESLRGAGVKGEGVRRDPQAPSGLAMITVTAGGENTIVVVPGANGRVTPADVEERLDLLAGADVLLLQLEIPLETVLYAARRARELGKLVILDPAPARPLPGSWAKLVDIITPNESEAEVLTGISIRGLSDAQQAAGRLLAEGFPRVIIKLGAKGALLAEATSSAVGGPSRLAGGSGQAPPELTPQELASNPKLARYRHFPAFSVPALDTTAAGDAFNAALAVYLGEGKTLEEAVFFANAAGALAATRVGAQPSLPYRREVEELLSQGSTGGATLIETASF